MLLSLRAVCNPLLVKMLWHRKYDKCEETVSSIIEVDTHPPIQGSEAEELRICEVIVVATEVACK